MIDHRPFIDRKADLRPDVQHLVGIGALAEGEYLVVLAPRIGLGRVRLLEGLAGDEEMHGLEPDSDASDAVRRKTAEAAGGGRLRPGAEQTFEQLDDVTAGFFPQPELRWRDALAQLAQHVIDLQSELRRIEPPGVAARALKLGTRMQGGI